MKSIDLKRAFFDTVRQHEFASPLEKAALEEDMAAWTRYLTQAVIKTCQSLGWQAAAKGQLIWEVAAAGDSKEPVVGTKVKEGQILCYVQTYYGMEPITALSSGKLNVIAAKQGAMVEKNEIIGFIA